jgi:hypothetical protein
VEWSKHLDINIRSKRILEWMNVIVANRNDGPRA